LFASYATGNPYVLWSALLKHYERDTMASKHSTRALMMSQRLGEGEDVSVYVSRITSYAQKLVSMGDIISEGDKLFALFNGLTAEYNAIKSILQLKDNVSFADAVQHLKDQYELMNVNHSNDTSSALYVNHKFKGGHRVGKGKTDKPYCSIHKFHGHATKDCYKAKGNDKNQQGNKSGKPYH
jgi:hypothetical protein